MSQTDPRIDTYIQAAAPFAVPILTHLRKLVHKACPGATETIKWGFPHFEYAGSILCNMAAFKQHCSFGFWKAAAMKDPEKLFTPIGETGMGHFGKITQLKDLPADKLLLQYLKEAAALNEAGVVKTPSKTKTPATGSKQLDIPDYFLAALKKNKKALATFEAFSYSNKKEYVTWVTEAKTEKTQLERLATAVEWMAEGKIRNWKYVK
ncbi:YdeI/OmpD-associated family protein [Chitinophaga nivalis]|uniref:YdeI/OmpD-associated family protein n=1 Tax=Chitinophaga nivalis TaxID=2991709 RepID=A0ABT3IM57_9BACT|nr:DUF1801 domain-containing protein [Chitinophaga nivalis]MCW3465263.1 YdeI/OmpD-associated family protein [Chitinophaga nivalis]MCW3485045.1 YdeI/OmpD-associated family protein [Chitinophaga nivalis]